MNVSTGVESKRENVDIHIYIIIHCIYNKFERILYGTWMHAFFVRLIDGNGFISMGK